MGADSNYISAYPLPSSQSRRYYAGDKDGKEKDHNFFLAHVYKGS